MGSLDGWARAACYVAARVDTAVNLVSVTRHCTRIGINIPDAILEPVVREVAAARAAGVLSFSSAVIGEMIQLTAAERQEHGIRRLVDACDQSPDDRRREAARRRSAKLRVERGVKPRSQSFEATKPWLAEGKSRSAWFRDRKLGQIRHGHPSKIIRKKGDRDETVPQPGDRDETVQETEDAE
ncbi:hypothetical protein [Devosia sp. UYZn731]|uniref:hypothetical protein n=1 Tax=Devosia sp. UYZn731 TaxID=3156345 RepID=UPI00339184B2